MMMDPTTELPNDLVYMIFLHLPPKSLARFRSLSTHWNQTITSKRFSSDLPKSSIIVARTYPFYPFSTHYEVRVHSLSPNTFHPTPTKHAPSSVPLPFPVPPHGGEIVTPTRHDRSLTICSSGMDGLLCLLYPSLSGQIDIALWNPCTNSTRMVTWPAPKSCESLELSFEFIGFGYDASIDDYKVVVVCETRDPASGFWLARSEVRVTYLKSGGGVWRKPPAEVPFIRCKPLKAYYSFQGN